MIDSKDEAMMTDMQVEICNLLMQYMVYSWQCGKSYEEINDTVLQMTDVVADDFQEYIFEDD